MFIMHKILYSNFTSLPCFPVLPLHRYEHSSATSTQYQHRCHTESRVLPTEEKCSDTNKNQQIHAPCAKTRSCPLTLDSPIGNHCCQYGCAQQNHHTSIANSSLLQVLFMDQPSQYTGQNHCPPESSQCSIYDSARYR